MTPPATLSDRPRTEPKDASMPAPPPACNRRCTCTRTRGRLIAVEPLTAPPIYSTGPTFGRSPATRRRARGPHWRSSNVNDPTIGAHEPRSTLPRRSRMVASRPRRCVRARGRHTGAAQETRDAGQADSRSPTTRARKPAPAVATAPDAIGSTAARCLGRTTMPSQPSVPHRGAEQRKRVCARTRLPTAGRSCQRASEGVDRALREHRQAKAESAEKVRPPGRRSPT